MKLKILFFPLSIVLSLVIIIWMVKPEWDLVNKQKKLLTANENAVTNIKSKILGINSALEKYNSQEVLNNRNLIINIIPYDSSDELWLSEVYDKVRQTGVILEKVNLEPVKKIDCKSEKGGAANADIDALDNKTSNKKQGSEDSSCSVSILKEMTVTLNLSGPYLKVRDFIKEIESMNRLNKITSFSIQREVQEGQFSGIVSATIVLKTYYKSDDSSVDLAKKLTANDKIMNLLTQGKISNDIIDNFKNKYSSKAYSPSFIITGTGKEDLFTTSTVDSNTSESSGNSNASSSSTASDVSNNQKQ